MIENMKIEKSITIYINSDNNDTLNMKVKPGSLLFTWFPSKTLDCYAEKDGFGYWVVLMFAVEPFGYGEWKPIEMYEAGKYESNFPSHILSRWGIEIQYKEEYGQRVDFIKLPVAEVKK